MRVFWTGVLSLFLALPLLAQEKKAEPPKKETTPLAEKVAGEIKAAQKELMEWAKEAAAATTDAERFAAVNKRGKILLSVASKVLKHAQRMPKDPAVVEALTMVGLLAPSTSVEKEALEQLRALHQESTDETLQLQAALALAKALLRNEPTAEQKKGAEKLLTEVKDRGKQAKLPEDFVDSAESLLFDLQHLQVGMKAPDTEVVNLQDKPVKISDHKGKVVVLDFWATWCPPCRAMIPHERELVKKYKDKPFVFVSISGDQKMDTAKQFLENHEMPWVHWWSGQKGMARKWNIEALPTMFIVDARGVIRGKIVGGGDENAKKLDELIAKLIKEASTRSE